MMAKLTRFLKVNLLAGLIVILPLYVTVYFLQLIMGSFDQLLVIIPEFVLPRSVREIPGLGFLFTILLALLAGIVARNIFGRSLIKYFNSLMERIPVIASIYGLLRQISETFLGPKSSGFKRVVLVEWPRKDIWTMAFVASEVQGNWAKNLQARYAADKLLNLFVPATPNPTSGFYFIANQKEVIPLDISVDQAFKAIISGGVLSPDDVTKKIHA